VSYDRGQRQKEAVMADIHGMDMQARDELFEDLNELTDDDMSVMTCCDPWTVKR
jgi:hypothetical protein